MVKVPLPLNASPNATTKRKHKTQALMGTTRPRVGKDAMNVHTYKIKAHRQR